MPVQEGEEEVGEVGEADETGVGVAEDQGVAEEGVGIVARASPRRKKNWTGGACAFFSFDLELDAGQYGLLVQLLSGTRIQLEISSKESWMPKKVTACMAQRTGFCGGVPARMTEIHDITCVFGVL